LELSSTVKNTGNVRLKPTFSVDIWDKFQTKIIYSTSVQEDNEVLPTTQRTFLNSFEHDLELGQYWAVIHEETCDNGRTLTFSIMDIGGVSDRGELLRIDNEPWAETNDIIRIAAIFKNLGTRVVNAKFKGTIELDDRIIEVIETDSLNVPPGELSELESFFNPKEPGRYMVRGRVIYNNKLTFTKASQINVRGDIIQRVEGGFFARLFKNPYQIAMIIIIIVISILILLIKKEKRKTQTSLSKEVSYFCFIGHSNFWFYIWRKTSCVIIPSISFV